MYTNIHIEFMKNSNPTHQITKASQTVSLRLDRTVCLLGSFHKNWKESGIWLGSNLSIITNFESTFNERPGNETDKHGNIQKTRPIGDLSTKIIHNLIPLWFWQPSPCWLACNKEILCLWGLVTRYYSKHDLGLNKFGFYCNWTSTSEKEVTQ